MAVPFYFCKNILKVCKVSKVSGGTNLLFDIL